MQPFTNEAAEPEEFPPATATVYAALVAAAIGASLFIYYKKRICHSTASKKAAAENPNR